MPEDIELLLTDEPDEEIRPELHAKACKEIKEKIEVEVSFDRTYVVVLAVHENPDKNSLTRIACRKGLPVAGYLYDSQTDAYHVECHDYLPLGFIPVSFYHTMPGVANWRQRIPMPEVAIRKYLNQQQKRDLRAFKAAYRGHQFHFMQIIDCY